MKALQIPVTLYIYANPYAFDESSRYLATMTSNMGEADPRFVLLDTQIINLPFTEPEPIDVIGKQIEGLQAQKERIAAESHRQQSAIDDKIQQLLCIDHSPVDEHELPY